MKNLLLAILVMGTLGLIAQNPSINEEWIPEKRMEQQTEFNADQTPYPAKPRSMWTVGLNVGLNNVAGDVNTRPIGNGNFALGYGVNVRKALGYAASLRLGYNGGTAYGQNWNPQSVRNNSALTRLVDLDNDGNLEGYEDGAGNDKRFIHNYKMSYHNAALDVIFNLNNLKFYKAENKVAFNIYAGPSLLIYQTKYNALDASNNLYDFSSVIELAGNPKPSDRRDAVEALLDDTYETLAEIDNESKSLGTGENEKPLRAAANVGAMVNFKVSDRISIDLEHRIVLPFDDLLDGQRWEAGGATFTPDKDAIHYSSVGVSIHIGNNAAEPSWFVNPMGYVYDELKLIQPPDMSDTDGDGVLDLLDKEPATKSGFPVDARGVTLDSDKDGCPDGEDPEPFSSPAYPIKNCQNVMPATMTPEEIEILVDNKIKPMMASAGADWFLPIIHFDLNRTVIKPEFYDELRYVADVMSRYPSLSVEVIGYADTRASEEYNMDLSRKRAESAIAHLTSQYSIDASRMVMRYEGENNELYKGARAESQHRVNRRVEFRVVPKK